MRLLYLDLDELKFVHVHEVCNDMKKTEEADQEHIRKELESNCDVVNQDREEETEEEMMKTAAFR